MHYTYLNISATT